MMVLTFAHLIGFKRFLILLQPSRGREVESDRNSVDSITMGMNGVYGIRHTATNRFYVGSSVNFKERFATHRRQLKDNLHPNKHLQCAWNKYGESAFDFILIEEDVENLLERERFYMNKHNSIENGFNIIKDPTAPKPSEYCIQKAKEYQTGRVHSEESKRKASESMKKVIKDIIWQNKINKSLKISGKRRMKPVVQLDLQDNVIKIWDSARTAAKELNICRGTIQKVVSGCDKRQNSITAGEFKWKHL